MGSNIIAHLIFFSLHTFYTLISQLPYILKSIQPQVSTILLYIFPSHFLLFLFLSLSLSLSLSRVCACARGKSSKKKPQVKQTDHYKSAYFWVSLVLPQHKYSKSNIYIYIYINFFFLLSKR